MVKKIRQESLEKHLAYNEDMLVDMFTRNKSFTDYTRAHNPRMVSTPESLLLCNTELAGYSFEERKRMANEIKSMRNALAMLDELAEFLAYVPFKWWGRGIAAIDRDKALEELIDLQHFLFVAVADLGFNAEDFYDAYVKKNNYNWTRFENQIGWGKTRLEHDDHPEGVTNDKTQ